MVRLKSIIAFVGPMVMVVAIGLLAAGYFDTRGDVNEINRTINCTDQAACRAFVERLVEQRTADRDHKRQGVEQNRSPQQSSGGSDDASTDPDNGSAAGPPAPDAPDPSGDGAGGSSGGGGGSAPGGPDEPPATDPPPTAPPPANPPADPQPSAPSLGDQVGGLLDGVTGTACGLTGLHLPAACP